MTRRNAPAIALTIVAATLVFAPGPPAVADPPTTGNTIVDETFTGSSVPDPAWTVQGVACLTGAPDGSPPPGGAQIPDCSARRAGPVPALGVTPGYLQLTDAANNAAGSMLYNRPIPATAGISVTFLQYQYGGTGADGIGFFLVDGSTNLTATGANGGSLGYAQKDAAQQGVQGGYVGVGLDSFGNYYNDGESRGRGCPVGSRSPTTSSGPIAPNVITARGPGNGLIGYCYLESTTPKPITNPNRPGTTLDRPLRDTTLAPSLREINVQVTPDLPTSPARIIVEIRYDPSVPGSPWVRELDIPAPPGIPGTYKLGFSASTGGSTDVHLVRNVRVDTIAPLPALQLEKQVDRSGPPLPAVIAPGTAIPYQFTVTNSGIVPIQSLTIVDPLFTTAITCDRTTLEVAPAVGSTAVCRGQYVVPAGASGAITNTAVAQGNPVGAPGTTVQSNPSTVTVALLSSMTLTKSVTSPPPYAVGQLVNYEYVVQNTGGSTLSSVVVSDNRIPRQTDIRCPQAQLAPTESMTCAGVYSLAAGHVAPNGTLTNTAVATAQTALGQSVPSNQAQQTINVFTDVGVSKVVDDDTPIVGDNVTFTVTATNNGPSLGQNIVVTDLLPSPRLTLVSSTPPAGTTYDTTSGAWAIPSLTVGASVTLQIVARVETNSPVANAATRTAMTQTDINGANDSASVTLNPIEPTLDLAVTKAVDDGDIPVGGRARFTVRVENNGPFAGTGIVVRDVLPDTLIYDAVASGGTGTYDPATGVWTVGALAVGAAATFDFVVTATQIGTFTNLAGLAAVSPVDTNPNNNTDLANLTVRAPIADLSIVKQVFPQQALVGDEVTYQVEVLNKGPETVQGVFVTDVDPEGVSLSTTTPPVVSKGTLDTSGDNLRWNIGDLAVNEAVQATVTARLDTAGTKVNTVTVAAPALTDPTPADNQSTATLTSDLRPVDIGVTKTVTADSGAPVNQIPVGETVTFAIAARNNSAANNATNVVFTDIIDPALTILSSTPSAGTTFDETTGTWTVGTLAAGTPGPPVTLTIQATTTTVGQQSNTIALSTLDQRDTDPTNNAATATITVIEEADLAITKENDPSTAQPGEQVDYEITVTNNGPNDAVDITAFDPQVIEAEIIDFELPPDTTFDPISRVWIIPALDDGESVTLLVSIRIRPGRSGQFVNTVAVSSSRLPDPDLSNNTDFATLFIPAADIAVDKQVDRAEALVGDTVAFTVAVDNRGPDPAAAVTVDDVLPSGLTFVSATPSLGSYDAASGVWTIGDLDPIPLVPAPAVPQATLRLVVRVDAASTFTNTAVSNRTGAFPFDPDDSNNASSAVVTGVAADVSVRKSVSPVTVEVGGTVAVALEVTNGGPAAATAVELGDTFPAALVPTAASDPRCTITGQVLACALGALPAGVVVTVTVTATAASVGDFTNTAVVGSRTPELTPGNNSSTASGQVVAAATTTTTTTTTTPSTTTTIPATSGSGGWLPGTGGEVARGLVVAAGLVALGVAIVVVARRRRFS